MITSQEPLLTTEMDALQAIGKYVPKESNRIALRTCSYCGKEAYSEADLTEFVSASLYKFKKRNTCKDCHSLLSNNKGVPITIAGAHCKLPKRTLKCKRCGLPNTSSTSYRFTKKDNLCDTCLLLSASERRSEEKPSSIVVKDFTTKGELEELAIIRHAELAGRPEEFFKMVVTQGKLND